MNKWAKLAQRTVKSRFLFLVDFLKKSGIDIEFEFLEVEPRDFPEQLKLAKQKFGVIRIGDPFHQRIIDELDVIPNDVRQVNNVDLLLKEHTKWNAYCFMHEALFRALAFAQKPIDRSQSCLVIGSGSSFGALVFALYKIGFRRFLLSGNDEANIQKYIKHCTDYFLSIDASYVSPNELTLIKPECSIMVNCIDLEQNAQIIKDLIYFNFLQSSGIVVDFNLSGSAAVMVEEAKSSGFSVITGPDVASSYDFLFVQKILKIQINQKDYLKGLYSALKL